MGAAGAASGTGAADGTNSLADALSVEIGFSTPCFFSNPCSNHPSGDSLHADSSDLSWLDMLDVL
jgi:hypothetical protein